MIHTESFHLQNSRDRRKPTDDTNIIFKWVSDNALEANPDKFHLAEHAEPKPSYNIIVTRNTSTLQTVFNPSLVFAGGSSCHYEMTLMKLETYCSFPNIKSTNNCMKISIDKEVTWKSISKPIGCYEIKAINKLLQRLIVEAGGKADKIIISPNNNILKCILDIKDVNYQINFAVENSLRTVMGFDAKIYKCGRHESVNMVDIMSVNSILVHWDIIGASRMNGIEAPVIYNFFPNAAPGNKIVSTPRNLIYVPITLNVISLMTSG